MFNFNEIKVYLVSKTIRVFEHLNSKRVDNMDIEYTRCDITIVIVTMVTAFIT